MFLNIGEMSSFDLVSKEKSIGQLGSYGTPCSGQTKPNIC